MKKLLAMASLVGLVLLVVAACTQSFTPSPAPAATPRPTSTAPPAPKTKAPQQPKTTPKPATTPQTKQGGPGSAAYYEGKTIEIIVESAAGGGTDTIARIIATHLPRYLPGNPKIIVRNQPGAQGAVANNAFFARNKTDGLTLMMNSSGPVGLQLMADPVVKFDLTKLRHVGNVGRAESVLMVKKGFKDKLADPGKALVVGTREGSESWQSMPFWGKEFLGWNVRWIPGFGGTSEMELAVRRGEMDMFGTANAFIVHRMVQENLMDTIATIGLMRQDKFLRRPDFPDVPTFDEFLGSKKPSGIAWQAYLGWVGPGVIDKTLAASQGTPDNIMAILTDSYARMAKDPQFDTTIKKLVSEVYDVTIGKETDALMKEILTVPPEAVKYQQDLKAKHFTK